MGDIPATKTRPHYHVPHHDNTDTGTIKVGDDAIAKTLRRPVQRAEDYSRKWATSGNWVYKPKGPTGLFSNAASYIKKHTAHATHRKKPPTPGVTRTRELISGETIPLSDKLAYATTGAPTKAPNTASKTDSKAEKELGSLIAGFISGRKPIHGSKVHPGKMHVEISDVEVLSPTGSTKIASR